ncbi:MAG: hypothetical protein ABI551_08495, partial [Polyangiaceae bacterium]
MRTPFLMLGAFALIGGCYTSDLVEAAANFDAGPSGSDGGGLFDGGMLEASTLDAGADAAAETCSDGSPIAQRWTSCDAAPPAASGALISALGSAARGDVVALGSAASAPASDCFPVRVCIPSAAPAMLFSDSPESPSTSGVLYADTVGPGPFRIYVYHTNGGNDGIARKFPVVVLNQGALDAHVTITAKGIAGPSADYVSVGKAAAAHFLAPAISTMVTVPAG